MATIGIDIGGHTHVAARCREGQAQADRKILRLTQSRAGFAALDAWLAARARADRAGRDGVLGPLLDGARCTFASIRCPGRSGQTRSRRATLRKAGSNAPSPIRPMPGASPRWPCATAHQHADPLAGVELRQSARFAMTLVTEQAEGLPEAVSPRRAWLPGASRAVRDPTCRTREQSFVWLRQLRQRPDDELRLWLNANAGPGRRRLGQAKAERLAAAAADSIAVPELDAEVAFEVGLLLDQFDLLERQIEAAEARVGELLRW